MTKSALPIAATVSILATAGLAENRIDTVRHDAPDLAAYGTYDVGVQTRSFTHAGQIDIVKIVTDSIAADQPAPTYDRDLTVEIWYPAQAGTGSNTPYTATLRDGVTDVQLHGQASRDATPLAGGTFPLVIISHGYPGNRFLMSHLGENLASKGYVTVSIDHTDSTYSDQNAFGSTLLNRAIDQKFIIDQMDGLDDDIGAITDAQATGVIGYSMGGDGALIFGGAGVTQASTEYSWGTPNGHLEQHLTGSDSHNALIDDRVKAMIIIGPWGMNAGFWDADGLAAFQKPTLLMAGGVDDVSVYGAIRQIFEGTTGVTRHLLTFEHANHNAAAPMPAPAESYAPSDAIDFIAAEHYADAVWDNVRMNNITQHFATAYLDLHLKADGEKADYFDLVENAGDGVIALDDAGKATADHTYWNGFKPRTAAGLRFETKAAGE